MKPALLALLLSACSFAGSNAAPSEADPDGGGDSQANDLDGDGIENEADNCPNAQNPGQENGDTDALGNACDNCPLMPNPPVATMGLGMIQRDHDGDGRGDACDLCPHIASADDADSDRDKIGAACDPDDGKKNPPAEFDGFYDPPINARWTVPSVVAGQFSDWKLVQTGDKRLWWKQTTLDNGRHQLIRNRPDIEEVFVDALFRIHEVQPAAGATVLRSTTISYGFYRVPPDDIYFNCGVRHDVQAIVSNAISASYNEDTPLLVNVMSWTGVLVERDIRVIGASNKRGVNDSRLNCKAIAAPATNITLGDVDSTLFPDGKVGLRTFGMTASFDYIFIVDKAVVP
jgi:hypothetical protein